VFQRTPKRGRSGAGVLMLGVLGLVVAGILAVPHMPGFGLNFTPPPTQNDVKPTPTRKPNSILVTALFTGSPRNEDTAVVVYLTINSEPMKKLTVYKSPWNYPRRIPITKDTLILVTVRNYLPNHKADCALTRADGNSPFGNLDYDTKSGGRQAASCSYPVPLGTPLGGR
jgi:hypothetical protein